MAVYTEVSNDELDAFVAEYDIGEVVSFKGIAEGVENSNFLLLTTEGQFILTLYEKRVSPADLPFFIGLMEHLAKRGIRCPTPLHGRDGEALRALCSRPAAIITFLEGVWPRRIEVFHCAALGEALAGMHEAGADFAMSRKNSLGIADWRPLFAQSADRADDIWSGLAAALDDELSFLERNWPQALPGGICHADLFPDNVFFRGERLSGLIDFYFACTEAYAYDAAICMNAWCFERDGSFNATKARALFAGYQRQRRFEPEELEALPILARGGAMRFLLTRLHDWLNHPEGAFVMPKDPLEYFRTLRFHQTVPGPSAYGLDE